MSTPQGLSRYAYMAIVTIHLTCMSIITCLLFEFLWILYQLQLLMLPIFIQGSVFCLYFYNCMTAFNQITALLTNQFMYFTHISYDLADMTLMCNLKPLVSLQT